MFAKVAIVFATLVALNAEDVFHRVEQTHSGTRVSSRHQDTSGNYAFGYDIVDGHGASNSRLEVGDAHGNKRGYYTLLDSDGRSRRVDYIADAHGYRATVSTNEPGTAHNIPTRALTSSQYASTHFAIPPVAGTHANLLPIDSLAPVQGARTLPYPHHALFSNHHATSVNGHDHVISNVVSHPFPETHGTSAVYHGVPSAPVPGSVPPVAVYDHGFLGADDLVHLRGASEQGLLAQSPKDIAYPASEVHVTSAVNHGVQSAAVSANIPTAPLALHGHGFLGTNDVVYARGNYEQGPPAHNPKAIAYPVSEEHVTSAVNHDVIPAPASANVPTAPLALHGYGFLGADDLVHDRGTAEQGLPAHNPEAVAYGRIKDIHH